MATIREKGLYQWQMQIRRKGWPFRTATFRSKRDAETWARQIEEASDRGLFVDQSAGRETRLSDLIETDRQGEFREPGEAFFAPIAAPADPRANRPHRAGPQAPDRRAVFISHANPEDNPAAGWFATQLTLPGYDVWGDLRSAHGGESNFWLNVQKTIENEAAKFVCFLSNASCDFEKKILRDATEELVTDTLSIKALPEQIYLLKVF